MKATAPADVVRQGRWLYGISLLLLPFGGGRRNVDGNGKAHRHQFVVLLD